MQEPKKGGAKRWHLNRVELSMGEGNERWYPFGDWMSADNSAVDITGKVGGEGACACQACLLCALGPRPDLPLLGNCLSCSHMLLPRRTL